MSKNKNSKPVAKTLNRGVGRPKAVIKWPAKKFTFADLCVANGVSTETGKGKMTKLTLRKHIAAEMFHTKTVKGKLKVDRENPRRNSVIVLLDETREPASTNGLGRKCEVYQLRAKRDAAKLASKVKATPAPVAPVTVDIGEAPAAPVVETPVAEVVTAPEVPAVAEVAAPVDATPVLA